MVQLKKRERKQLEKNPVRTCSKECYFFKNGQGGCHYFKDGEAEIGKPCTHDLVQIKRYAEAFTSGDTQTIKDDASRITAMVMMQIQRMLEQIQIDGPTVQEPIMDARGNPIWMDDPNWDPAQGGEPRQIMAMRVKDHPLISRAIQLARSIGVNLNDFKLTPKSADEKAQVSGHILVEEPDDLKKVMEDRAALEADWAEKLAQGNAMTMQDPVYQKMKEDGEID